MPTPSGEVAHLLRRAGFGGSPAEVAALTPLDIRAIVDRVLDVSLAPPVVRPAIVGEDGMGYQQWVAMTQWWLERMRTTTAPLAEKMTLFWHGHLCSGIDKVDRAHAMWDQNQPFREQRLGSFVDLVQAASTDPAMLVYLDNTQNRKAPRTRTARSPTSTSGACTPPSSSRGCARMPAKCWAPPSRTSASCGHPPPDLFSVPERATSGTLRYRERVRPGRRRRWRGRGRRRR